MKKETENLFKELSNTPCNIEQIEKEIKNGAEINLRHKETGETPLTYILLKKLRETYNNININNTKCTKSPDEYKIIQLLLENNANPNIPSKENITPLHYACMSQDIEIINLLLKYNADPSQPNNDGVTPLIATITTTKSVLKTAEKKRLGIMPSFNFKPDKKNNNRIEIIKSLINHGAEINTLQETTPLHSAIIVQDIEAIKYLLENKANPNIKSYGGLTALHMACTLLYTGADTDLIVEIINLLEKYKIDKTIKTKPDITENEIIPGKTAYELVKEILKEDILSTIYIKDDIEKLSINLQKILINLRTNSGNEAVK